MIFIATFLSYLFKDGYDGTKQKKIKKNPTMLLYYLTTANAEIEHK